jgi:hypothetical protein
VLELAARGLNDKEIAAYLGISRRTVRDRFDEMRERTGTRTRVELIACAAEAGLVRPAPSVPPADPTAGQGWPEGPEHQDVTAFPPRSQHFVDNETLRMRDADMAGPSGDRGDTRTFVLRSLDEDSATMDRARAWQSYPVRDEPSISAQDVLDALYQIKAGHDRLDHAERALIDMARGRGVTWLTISQALGVGTAQAAQQRRKRLGDPPGVGGLPDFSSQA